MSRARALDVNAVALGVAAALAGGVIAYFALSSMARPAGASARIAEVARQTADVDRMAGKTRTPSPYPVGAVCDGADAGAAAVRQTVTTLAGQAGVFLADVQAQPQTPDEANGGLQPVRLVVSGSGSSDGVQALLRALSKSTPSIFVDTLDLRPTDGAVALKLSGRFFCSPVRP